MDEDFTEDSEIDNTSCSSSSTVQNSDPEDSELLENASDLTSHMRMNLWLKVQMKTNKMKLILMVSFCKIFKIVVKKYKHWINGVVVVIATLICYVVQENIGVVMKLTSKKTLLILLLK